MTGGVEMSSFRPWLDISLVWCQREMWVVSCHYMSHSISQYYGPHRETNLNIITARVRPPVSMARSRSYFLIIPPGLQRAVYRRCDDRSGFVHFSSPGPDLYKVIIISSHLSPTTQHITLRRMEQDLEEKIRTTANWKWNRGDDRRAGEGSFEKLWLWWGCKLQLRLNN